MAAYDVPGKESVAASAGALPPAPVALRYVDSEHGFAVELKCKLFKDFETSVGTSPVDSIGLLLGWRTPAPDAAIAIDEAAILEPHSVGVVPFSPHVRREIGRWSPPIGNSVSAIGLFFIRADGTLNAPKAKDLLTIDRYFSDSVPLLVLANISGIPSGRLYVWVPSSFSIFPTGSPFPLSPDTLVLQSFVPFIPKYEQLRPQATNPIVVSKGLVPSPAGKLSSISWMAIQRPQSPKTVAALAASMLAIGAWFLLPERSDGPSVVESPQLPVVPSRQAEALGLDVTRTGSDLRIRWDRQSLAVREAEAGSLRISDNVQRIDLPLSAQQLAIGQVLYSPRSRDVEVTFRITTPSGTVSESVQVIQARDVEQGLAVLQPASPNPVPRDPPAIAPAQRQSSSLPTAPTAVAPRPSAMPSEAVAPPASGLSAPRVEVADKRVEPPPAVPQAAVNAPAVTAASQPSVESVGSPAQLGTAPIAPRPTIATPPTNVVATPAVARVMTSPVLLTKPVVNPLPATLWQMVKHRNSTELKIRLAIDDRGRISQVQPLTSQAFDRVVTSFVQSDLLKWRYTPATINGKSVPSEQIVILNLKPAHN